MCSCLARAIGAGALARTDAIAEFSLLDFRGLRQDGGLGRFASPEVLFMSRSSLLAFCAGLLLLGCSSEPAPTTSPQPSTAPRYLEIRSSSRAGELASTGALDTSTAAAVQTLFEHDPNAWIVVDRQLGRPIHATGRLSLPSASAAASWRKFVHAHAEMLRLSNPDSELVEKRAATKYLGSTVHRLRQVVHGIPVWRRSLKIEVDADGVGERERPCRPSVALASAQDSRDGRLAFHVRVLVLRHGMAAAARGLSLRVRDLSSSGGRNLDVSRLAFGSWLRPHGPVARRARC